MSRRKPWRKFKKERWKKEHIRCICALLIIMELAVLGRQGRLPFPTVEIKEGREVIIYRQPKEGKNPKKDQIYGIRIRLKEGVVDFYKKEELKD